LSIAMLLFSLCRVVFIIANPETIHGSVIENFLVGLRFDLAAVVMLHSLFILLHVFPAKIFANKFFQSFASILFHTVNAIAILFNLIDTAWFPFSGKRTTSDFFSLISTGDDVSNNLTHYLFSYWYLLLVLLIMTIFSVLIYKKVSLKLVNSSRNNSGDSFAGFSIRLAFSVALIIIGARGGLQLKPISMQSAAGLVDPGAVPMVLNTPFTILKSVRDEPIPSIQYLSEKDALALFNPHQQMFSADSFNNKNVVIIIMESFSSQFIGSLHNGNGYTPFLDSLMKHSLVCDQTYANGKRSIEGVPAVVASLPHLMDEPFITSAYNVNRINTPASILGKKGYSSAFFHGGNNGTMGFDNFSRVAGYNNYFGRNEYDGPISDYDGHWGIFDDQFFQFMIRKINSMKAPFVSTIFSLSSHEPYTIPARLKNKFPKGTEPIHESIGYADYALQQFFAEASKQSWYKNTLFVITADHTGPASGEFNMNRIGQLKIPLIIFDPQIDTGSVIHEVTQQTDIFPTILDYLHFNGKYAAFGQSVFNSKTDRWNISYLNGSWQLIQGKYLLQFNGNESTALYDIESDSLLKNNLIDQLPEIKTEKERLLKSILQQYRNGLLKNKIGI
ncbi:MAG TPA: sulfatase-like hydrolase/transferase, partial [Bacteroidia bacterium]|nr:sulfatase-like hydrolase/transferase [Bacteroidia bacterium]